MLQDRFDATSAPYRKRWVVDKPTEHGYSNDAYAAAAAASAQAANTSRLLQTWSGCPFATDSDYSPFTSRSSSRPGSIAGDSGSEYSAHHMSPPTPTKISNTVFEDDIYSDSLAAKRAATQQRLAAAAKAPSPFAVTAGEGGMAYAPSGRAYQYRRPQRLADPPAKPGSEEHCYRKPGQMEATAKVGGNGPRVLKLKKEEPTVKVGGEGRRYVKPKSAEPTGKVGSIHSW